MKRSLSHSFKEKKGSSSAKNIGRAQSSFGFMTTWKFRNGHQSHLNETSKSGNKDTRNSNISFFENSNRVSVDNKQQAQIKAYIRNMKNTDKTQNKQENQIKNQQINKVRSVSKMSSQAFIQLENDDLSKLDALEKRIEELIKIKLLKKGINYFCMSRNHEDQFQREMKSLIKQLKALQVSNDSQNQQYDAEICQIQKKITIYQKLIAESSTESDLLKKFYYAKRIMKKPALAVSKNLANFKAENLKNLTFASSFGVSSSIHYQTTNQASFKKPDKSHYKTAKKSENSFFSHKHVVPRSVYQRQYLNYGGLPVYHYKSPNNYIESKSIGKSKQSIYNSDFKWMKCSQLDYTNMDCKTDKIKSSDIWFMDRSQNINQKVIKPEKKTEKKVHQQKKTKKDESDFLLGTKSVWNKQNTIHRKQEKMKNQTQHQNEFVNKKVVIQNPIKDKSLLNMKYSFKRLAKV